MQPQLNPSSPPTGPRGSDTPSPGEVRRILARRSFATLATSSASGRPHAAGVLYELVDDAFWINTLRTSRKARNIEDNPRVAVTVPVRRLPVGPPSSVQFQSTAELVALDDGRVTSLLDDGRLRSLTGHGELDLPHGCFVRIASPGRILTHGLGMSLRRLIADPIGAGRVVDMA